MARAGRRKTKIQNMTPEENSRVSKLENTVSLLIKMNALAFQQTTSLNGMVLQMFSVLKAAQNLNSTLFQSVANQELRELLAKQQSQMNFQAD